MIRVKLLKYSFFILLVSVLILLAGVSRNAGITCDEVLHYNHSVAVYNYFATNGKDLSALNTPETHLKFYGQSYDNLTTILTEWLGIDDTYLFRHIMSAAAGWFVIMITALFAVWISGYGTGIIVILLFAVSPTFLGHSQNNLKDIPFALAYISSVFFILKLFYQSEKMSVTNICLLIISIAFAISIRAGGLILFCYLYLFFFLFHLERYLFEKRMIYRKILNGFLIITGISLVAYSLSLLLWPFALQDPVKNVFESYKVMANFPATFRQIFEGREEWSDYMPWYYLVKSMLITIPLVVTAGLLLAAIFSVRLLRSGYALRTGFIAFTVLFPLVFVIIEGSNLYSSWRQFLFIYPGIILLSAEGFSHVLKFIRNSYLKLALTGGLILLAVHPLKYMVSNVHYWYIYYNQLVGGLRGANGNYETDYYYVGRTEACRWLLNKLELEGDTNNVRIGATYSVSWDFRKYPGIRTSYFRYEERSQSDWDYAVITNRYIPPYKLKNGLWPPQNACHIVYADSVPICAVIKRNSRDDYSGYRALNLGEYTEAIRFFENAVKENTEDELIFFNFAAALVGNGQAVKADSVLNEGLKINPGSDLILMYLGNLAKAQNKTREAAGYYEKVIGVNRKYFKAYIELSELIASKDLQRSRKILRECLLVNPGYKPAMVALADSYRISDPEVAKKYDAMANQTK